MEASLTEVDGETMGVAMVGPTGRGRKSGFSLDRGATDDLVLALQSFYSNGNGWNWVWNLWISGTSLHVRKVELESGPGSIGIHMFLSVLSSFTSS